MLEKGFGCGTAKVALSPRRECNFQWRLLLNPDGFGGGGRRGKSDSRLGESTVFEERTILKISSSKGGGGGAGLGALGALLTGKETDIEKQSTT